MLNREEPSEYGEIEFKIGISPASIQAKAVKKDRITKEIRKVTEPLKYLFLGDLKLEIDWYGQPKSRFETDKSPDVDNIVKPIIDALCGPKGVLIDDCQLQAVSTFWFYEYSGVERFTIRLKYLPDEWTFKRDLAFIRFSNALCLPLEMNIGKESLGLVIDLYRRSFVSREELIKLGIHDSYSRAILPTYRVFHRSRVKDFRVINDEDFENHI